MHGTSSFCSVRTRSHANSHSVVSSPDAARREPERLSLDDFALPFWEANYTPAPAGCTTHRPRYSQRPTRILGESARL